MSESRASFSCSRYCLGLCLCLLLVGQATAQTPVATRVQPEPDRNLVPLADVRPAVVAVTQDLHEVGEQPEVRNLYQAASALARDGKYDAAVDRLNAALNRSTQNYYELLYLIALAKFRLGADGEARVYAAQAAQAPPVVADAQYLLGEVCRRQVQLDSAIAHYRAATVAQHEPANPRAIAAGYHLAECLAQRGFLTAAYEAYTQFDEALLQLQPDELDAEEIAPLVADRPLGTLQERVELLQRLKRYPEAVNICRAAIARFPDSIPAQRLLVRTLLNAAQPQDALDFCRQHWPDVAATTELPTSAPATAALLTDFVQAVSAAGQLSAWTADLRRQVSSGGSMALAAAAADRLSHAGAHQAAAELWTAIAAQRPHDSEPVWAAALAQRAAGELPAAVRGLTEFLRSSPDAGDLPWRRLIAWLEPDEQRAPETLDYLNQQLAVPDRDYVADFVLATLAVQAGQDTLAEQLFADAVAADPGFALAQVAWAQSRVARYDWDQAKAHAEGAVQAAPRFGAAHFVLAAVHAGLDENENAETEYRAAVKYAPRDVDYLVALGHFYKRRDDLLGAQRYFQQALAVDPNHGEAVENLIESYLAGGKPGLARAQFREAECADLAEPVLRRVRTTLHFSDRPFGPEHLAELQRQFTAEPRDLETGLKLAAGLLVRGRYEEAFPHAQTLHAEFPQDLRATVVLARLLVRRLDFHAAADLLQTVITHYPNRTEPLKLLAVARMADFQLDESRQIVDRLIDLAKSDATRDELRAQLLISYVEFSEFEPALDLLEKWTAAQPETTAWWRERLRVLALAGRKQEALDLAASRVAPVELDFQRKLGDLKRMVEQYKQLPQDDPSMRARAENLQAELKRVQANLRELRAEFVQIGMQARRYPEVETRLREWLVDQPTDPEIVQWLVLLLIQDDRPDEALDQLDSFSANGVAGEAALRGWRAEAEAAAGRAEKAAAELDTLLDDSPAGLSTRDRAEIWAKLISILTEAQRYDDALARCDEWLSELPARELAVRLVVERSRLAVLAAAGRQQQYMAESERLLEAAPDDTSLNNDLGYSWVDAGVNVDRAINMIRKAVADEPLRAAYLDSLGWAYYKTGDIAQACEYLRRAARLREGQESVIFDHLGDASFRNGDREAARSHWQKASEMVEQEQEEGGMARPPDLPARIRAKLADLENGKDPEVAPTAGKK